MTGSTVNRAYCFLHSADLLYSGALSGSMCYLLLRWHSKIFVFWPAHDHFSDSWMTGVLYLNSFCVYDSVTLCSISCMMCRGTSSPTWVIRMPGEAPKNMDHLCRSLHSILFYGKTGFQKDLDYFLPFLKNFFGCIGLHTGIIDVLQVFCSFTLFQCSLGQSMAIRLCSHPWGSWFQVYNDPSKWKQNVPHIWPPKGLRKRHWQCQLWHSTWLQFTWKFSTSGPVALSSGTRMTSFHLQISSTSGQDLPSIESVL